MKILMLDCDGVLNTSNNHSLWGLSRPCLRQLERIVKETDCKIVLSSTWRILSETRQFLIKKLRYRNLYLFGYTPQLGGTEIFDKNDEYLRRACRGDEIQSWLDAHPEVENYVIVDDDSDMLDSQLPNFVQTTMENGLTEEKASEIISLLNKEIN